MKMKRLTLAGLFLMAGLAAQNLSAQTSCCSGKLRTASEGIYDLTALYQKIDSVVVADKNQAAPLIGITSQYESPISTGIGNAYIEAVKKAGGIPVIIPKTDDPTITARYIDKLDGLLLAGGEDIHPFFYGADPDPKLGEVCIDRDFAELALIHLALRKGLPIMGICRGMQLMNVALGGTLLQDIPSAGYTVQHNQNMNKSIPVHEIHIEAGSRMAEVTGASTMQVNSTHHQCVKDVAPGLKVVAYSNDKVPEALEGFPKYNVITVQFHPEGLCTHNPSALKLLQDLVRRAVEYRDDKK